MTALLAPPAAAQSTPAGQQARTAEGQPTPKRPRVALVLSGGGARGFAHIGVLRVLEELNVPVDVVTGTSMGSIIGGLYATGYNSAQLTEVVKTTDWESIFATRAPRGDLDWRRKEDDYKNLSNFEVGIVDGSLTLPRGVAGTQRLEFFLRSLAGPSRRVSDLSKLPVPFAAIGADLETGQRVVLQKDVALSTAMRASMSVPGAFPPVEINGRLLVDGGIVDNFPVDAARAMGADVVIAVNVGTPPLKRSELTSVLSVATQLTLILGLESIERSIASLKPTDILISPQLDGLGSGSFDEGEKIIAAGEAAARQVIERLAALGVAPDVFAAREAARTQLVRDDGPVRIDEVQVAGTKAVRPDVIEAQAKGLEGQTVTPREIEPTLNRIFSSGDFEAVSYKLVDDGNRSVIVITPFEKSWGYNVLRIGGNVQTNFNDDNTFNLLLAHSWRWLNRWGAEWRNEVQIGDTRRFVTEWYQPLGAGSRWFVQPRLEAVRQEQDLFVGGVPITRFENKQQSAEFWLGVDLQRFGMVRGGVAASDVSYKSLIGFPFEPFSASTNSVLGQFLTDTLNDVILPTRGYYLNMQWQRYEQPLRLAFGPRQTSYSYGGILPLSFGRTTVSLSARGGTADLNGQFSLGGLFNLTGTRTGEVSGDHGVLLRSLFFRNISDLAGLKMPVFAGFSLESGDAVRQNESLSFGNFRHAASVFLNVQTLVGPIFLGAGRTQGIGNAVYLFWGRPQ
ncbi:MAG: patatin-like phospholipase family protein [Betaproteobacteria bacterium]